MTEFAALNFEETGFIDKNRDAKPMFKLTKDSYMLKVMRFTGTTAMQMKVKFIQALTERLTKYYVGRKWAKRLSVDMP